MDIDDARRCVLDGITLANQTYVTWSGGDWLTGAAVEGFLVAKIGEQLYGRLQANSEKGYVTLETRTSTIADQSGGIAGARYPRYLREHIDGPKRIDVVLWKGETPQAPVELKRGWNPNACCDDVYRVAALLQGHGAARGGTLEFGFVAWLAERSLNARKDGSLDARIEAQFQEIADWFDDRQWTRAELADGIALSYQDGPLIKGGEDWEDKAVCITLQPK